MNLNQNSHAEAHVIDRMMYMLEERSVTQLASENPSFAAFVGQLYRSLEGQSEKLRTIE